MASSSSLASTFSRLQVSNNDNNLDYIAYENGHVNGVTVKAKPGARAYRNHVTIIVVTRSGREKCLTERKSKRDMKDLPISSFEQRINYMILTDAYDVSHHFGVNDMSPVYDNRSMMYTPVPIEPLTITLAVDDLVHACGDVAGEKVVIIIRNAEMGYLDLNDSRFFVASDSVGREDHELRTFYELLSAQGSIDLKKCISVGRELYIDLRRDNQRFYHCGTSFLQGFKKNARIVSDNGKAAVKIIVDPVESLFFAQQTLDLSFLDIVRTRCSDPVKRFVDLYKNIRVYLTFYRSKVLPVHGLSRQLLQDLVFDYNGTPTRVIDYFYDHYHFESRAGQLPALEVRLTNGQHCFYPLDCVEVLKAQKVPLTRFHLISPTVNDDILKRNAVKAPERFNRTLKCFSYLEISHHIFESFGVSYESDQRIELGIRGKPMITFADDQTVKPNGKTGFAFQGKRYIDPSSCKKWMVITPQNLRRDVEQSIRAFLQAAEGRRLGLANPDFNVFNSADLRTENWDHLFSDLLEYGYHYVLLIDLKKDRLPQTHQMLKCYELRYGIQTQHVHSETLKKKMSLDNILHKVNMKLHGLNYHVVLEPCSISGLFYDDKIFVIGYDVAHSTATRLTDEPEPSVVGVSFNACRQYQSFNGNYFFQGSKQEAVNGDLLKKTIIEGLEMRHQQRPKAGIPEMVFVFRDGLSEGQFWMAKNEELKAIKDAVAEYYGPGHQLPPFEMVLATKRHNRRFYTARHENVLPGTVASNGISRLGAEEFYMQSAYPLQGTAKLTDYEVIANEANLSLNDIQAFTHGMCYLHQIVSSAVSLPEPVFQSHELAKRGRNNYQCYRSTHGVPNSDKDAIALLNDRLTYTGSSLLNHRFTA